MLDSVVLKIRDFVLYDNSYFLKSKWQEFRGKFGVFGKFYSTYTDYPNQQKKLGIYYPQISIIYNDRKRKGRNTGFERTRHLLVQVSVPKLIYNGTSLFDVHPQMLDLFCIILSEKLKEIKLEVKPESIKQAIVTRVDYSKILKISPSYGTTNRMIKELSKYEYKQRSDFNQNKFFNGKDGCYIKFYNSSQSLVIYDKFEEITSQGTTKLDKEIARQYQTNKYKSGALRIELSLQTKQIVDLTLKRVTKRKKKFFTLADIWSIDIAKKLLIENFRKVYIDGFNSLIYLSQLKDIEVYQYLKKNTDNLNQTAILYLLAHRVKAIGLKETIKEVQKAFSPATVSRYKKKIETLINDMKGKQDKMNIPHYLLKKLNTFTPVYPKKIQKIFKF